MADWRLVNGTWTDVDFATEDDWRLVGGTWTQSTAAAAAGGVTEIPPPLHGLDNQHAVIMANRLNGVIQ